MGHAKEIVQNMKDFKKFDCIVCCSGDGIINEVKTSVLGENLLGVHWNSVPAG
jgi:diacylglycerol kinase family enzyme